MSELIFPAAHQPQQPRAAEPNSRHVCFVPERQCRGIAIDRVRELLHRLFLLDPAQLIAVTARQAAA